MPRAAGHLRAVRLVREKCPLPRRAASSPARASALRLEAAGDSSPPSLTSLASRSRRPRCSSPGAAREKQVPRPPHPRHGSHAWERWATVCLLFLQGGGCQNRSPLQCFPVSSVPSLSCSCADGVPGSPLGGPDLPKPLGQRYASRLALSGDQRPPITASGGGAGSLTPWDPQPPPRSPPSTRGGTGLGNPPSVPCHVQRHRHPVWTSKKLTEGQDEEEQSCYLDPGRGRSPDSAFPAPERESLSFA